MLNNYFDNLDNPEHLHFVIEEIYSVDDVRSLKDILKMLSIKKQAGQIAPEHELALKQAIYNRESQLMEEQKQKHNNNGGKRMLFRPNNTSISNRTGAANIIFLIANIAITAVMYTLLFIAHFLNN